MLKLSFSVILSLLFLGNIYYLEKNNVSRGSFYFYTTKFCFIRDCALNSVDSTYGVITFPSRIQSNEFDRVSFDLRDDEYLDINQLTPPECFYFGWGIYLLDRWYDYEYHQYGASLNDSINIFKIQEQIENRNPFGKEIRIFITYNDNIIRELQKLYANQKNIFYLTWNSFPRNLVPFNSTGDRLMTYFRILMPSNVTRMNEYLLSNPVSVFRYKMNINLDRIKPQGIWKKRSFNGKNEKQLIGQEYNNFFQEILELIKFNLKLDNQINLYSAPHLNSIQYDNGWDCIQYKKTCLVDNRDTVYVGNGYLKDHDVTGYPIKDKSLIFVFGVNHTYFSNSLYNSLQLYDYTNEQGFYSFHGFRNYYEKSRSYFNSCKTIYESLSKKTYPFDGEVFYCILISRENFELWNFNIEIKEFYKQISIQELPYSNLFTTVERSYLQDQNMISSAYDNLIYPTGIILY
jgi:hypothetical protein